MLLNHRDLNAHFLGDKMRYFTDVNLGMAVDTPRGLLVPTIFGANKMSLNEIAGAAKDLAKQAQEEQSPRTFLWGRRSRYRTWGRTGGTFHAGHQPAADGHPGSEQHPDEAEDGGRGSGAVPGDGNFADIRPQGARRGAGVAFRTGAVQDAGKLHGIAC